MTDPTAETIDGASSGDEMDDNEASTAECHDTVSAAMREHILEKYGYRCQGRGRYGPERGGVAELEVHHIERDPDGLDEHDPANLTVLCRSCHNWLHHQSMPDDVPVELTDAELDVVSRHGVEILQYLAEHGPASTSDVAAALTADVSVTAVRERLWVLMGLDNEVAERDEQLVDKDIETGEWGLAEQIVTSARRHIPDSSQLLLQRVEDEQVRRALDSGMDRDAVMNAFDVSRRSTFYKQKRARAFDFPLDALTGRGGRPTSSGGQRTDTSTASAGDDEAQQRLETVTAESGDADSGPAEAVNEASSSSGEATVRSDGGGKSSRDDDTLQTEVRNAIAALKEVESAL